MRSLFRTTLSALLGGIALVAPAAPALAAETSNSEFVIIREGDVFPEDLYAGAIRVVVEGTLEGDLMAFAAEEVVINGTVTGSVTTAAPRVTVDGEIDGSLRVAGNRLDVGGDIEGDLVATVVTASLRTGSGVEGDVLLWAWDVAALGSVGGDLTGSQRSLDLAGDISGDVDVSVSSLAIVDELNVSGDLGYRSGTEATGIDQATVGGATVDKEPLPPNIRVRALTLLGRFLVILFLTIAALTTAYGWPRRASAAVVAVGKTPIRDWLKGALIIFSPAIAIAVAGVILGLAPAAAAFPLLVVLVPVILALVGIVFASALVAGAPTVGWLGGVLFKRLDLYGSIVVGSLIAGIVWYLPLIGWLVPIVVLPLGLGAWIGTWSRQSADPDMSPVPVSTP